MILDETNPHANGVAIPKLGLGTWFIEDSKDAQAVHDAIKPVFPVFGEKKQ